jgi:hypothetical protein
VLDLDRTRRRFGTSPTDVWPSGPGR